MITANLKLILWIVFDKDSFGGSHNMPNDYIKLRNDLEYWLLLISNSFHELCLIRNRSKPFRIWDVEKETKDGAQQRKIDTFMAW